MEWYGALPGHWDTKKINDLFSERREKVSDTDFAPLSVSKGGIVPQISTVAKTNAGDNRKRVCVGDFVINSRSDRRGSSGVSKYDGSVSLINIVLEPRAEHDRQFLHYLLRSHGFIEEYYRNGRGIVADLWTTRYTEMKSIYLPIPPRDEQPQIVRFLDWKVTHVNKLINAKRREIGLLQEQKQAVIQYSLDSIKANSIPCRHIGSFQNGISESGGFFIDGDFPFVNYSDVYKNDILPLTFAGTAKSNTKQQETYSVREGDIFFTRTSETLDEVGLTSVCQATVDNAVFSGFLIRMRPQKGVLNTNYSRYFFRSKFVRDYFTKEMNSVIRASLGQNLLKNLPVILPSLEEQGKIAALLDTKCGILNNSILAIQTEISLLQEYRTRLISDVVTGKLDVRDAVVPKFEAVEEIVENEQIEDEDIAEGVDE